jgi:hypothetical protein
MDHWAGQVWPDREDSAAVTYCTLLPADPPTILQPLRTVWIMISPGDGLEDFPLAEYAAKRRWVDYSKQFENLSRDVKQSAFFTICMWIYDPAVLTWQRMTQPENENAAVPVPQSAGRPLALPRTLHCIN